MDNIANIHLQHKTYSPNLEMEHIKYKQKYFARRTVMHSKAVAHQNIISRGTFNYIILILFRQILSEKFVQMNTLPLMELHSNLKSHIKFEVCEMCSIGTDLLEYDKNTLSLIDHSQTDIWHTSNLTCTALRKLFYFTLYHLNVNWYLIMFICKEQIISVKLS